MIHDLLYSNPCRMTGEIQSRILSTTWLPVSLVISCANGCVALMSPACSRSPVKLRHSAMHFLGSRWNQWKMCLFCNKYLLTIELQIRAAYTLLVLIHEDIMPMNNSFLTCLRAARKFWMTTDVLERLANVTRLCWQMMWKHRLGDISRLKPGPTGLMTGGKALTKMLMAHLQ